MLTLILLLWLRKARITGETNAAFIRQRFIRMIRLVLPCLLMAPFVLMAQTKTYKYQVRRNQSIIGNMSIVETSDSPRKTIILQSDIRAKVLFTINVTTKEKTMMEDQRIVFAESTRKVSGSEEVYKRLLSVGNGYRLQTASKQLELQNTMIFNNTVSLYIREPVNSMLVFSDACNQLLTLRKTGDHVYVLGMPDGNQNTYRYQDGICKEVIVEHKFFTAQIVLDKIIQQ